MKKLILFLSTLLFLSFLKAEDSLDLVDKAITNQTLPLTTKQDFDFIDSKQELIDYLKGEGKFRNIQDYFIELYKSFLATYQESGKEISPEVIKLHQKIISALSQLSLEDFKGFALAGGRGLVRRGDYKVYLRKYTKIHSKEADDILDKIRTDDGKKVFFKQTDLRKEAKIRLIDFLTVRDKKDLLKDLSNWSEYLFDWVEQNY